MYIRIKRTRDEHVEETSEQDNEYERVDALKQLTLRHGEELDNNATLALYRYLGSGRAPEGSMGMSHLDGFMTAVIASRDGVPVPEWMPKVGADEEPEFEDIAEAELVFTAMIGRCRQIDVQVRCDGDLVCILERGPQGQALAGAWCRGFLQGIMLSPAQWAQAFEHELGQSVLLPIVLNAAHDRAFGVFFSEVEERVCESLPDLVIALRHPFWASELPDVWASLRASAARDADSTGVSSAGEEGDGDAIPSRESARESRRADPLRERLGALMKRGSK